MTIPPGTRLRGEQWQYALMLAPAVLVLLAIILVPLGYLLYTSLLEWKLTDPLGKAFVGGANYLRMLRDADFWHAIRVTVVFIGGSVGLQLGLGLILVESLSALRRGAALIRTALLLPMVIPPLVVGLIWRILYDPTAGLANYLLGFVGLSHPWLADYRTALGAVILTDVWEWTPFVLLILLASYAAIPEAIHEAAAVDGATRWERFRFITFPLVRPMLITVAILRMIDVIREFAKIFVTTGGGPGTTTETVNIYTYRQGFVYGDMGYAATLGVFMFVAVLCLTLAALRLERRLAEAA
jgi:multiple sugar transport system permease protein